MATVTNTITNAALDEVYEAVAITYGTYGLPLPVAEDTATQAGLKKVAIIQAHVKDHLIQTVKERRRQKKREEADTVPDPLIT
jgi:hypothetical protein